MKLIKHESYKCGPSNKAAKGARGCKKQIGRCYRTCVQDNEERSIERTVRQDGKRQIREQTDD